MGTAGRCSGTAMARRHHPRAARVAMALLVPCQVGTAIQCLHSVCSDEFCLTQDAVTTELVDCALLVSTYTLEGVTHSLPPGVQPTTRSSMRASAAKSVSASAPLL